MRLPSFLCITLLVLITSTIPTFGQGWHVEITDTLYHEWSSMWCIEVQGNYAFAAIGTGGIISVNLDDPSDLSEDGRISSAQYVRTFCINDHYLYAASDYLGLLVIDIADPLNMVLVNTVSLPVCTWGVDIMDDLAYVSSANNLYVFDISDPENPVEVNRLTAMDDLYEIDVYDGYCYCHTAYDFFVIDLSDPLNPVQVGSYAFNTTIGQPLATDEYVYLPNGYGLYIMDVRDPANPTPIGICEGDIHSNIVLEGDYVYAAARTEGLQIVDVSDPSNPFVISNYPPEYQYFDIIKAGDICYATDTHGTLQAIDVSDPFNPVAEDDIHYGTPYKVALSGDYAYVASKWGGLQIVNIADPNHIYEVSQLVTPGLATGVCLDGDIVYIADNEGGLRVIDASDPTAPVEIGSLEFDWNAINVSVYGGYAYVNMWICDGVHIVDISDPAHPFEVASYIIANHGTTDIAFYGNYAYLAYSCIEFTVLDITDPTNPTGTTCYYDQSMRSIAVWGDYAYRVGSYSGLDIMDLSDPANPVQVAVFPEFDEGREINIADGFAYIARSDSGLFILDLEDPLAPILVGCYDTPGETWDVAPMGLYACVADYQNLSVFDCTDAVTGTVEIELSYQAGSPLPPEGGNIDFDLYLVNAGISTEAFDAWLDISFPGISPVTLALRSFTAIPPGWSLSRPGNFLPVGSNWPAGTYTVTGNTGGYQGDIWYEDDFTFDKSGYGGAPGSIPGITSDSFDPFGIGRPSEQASMAGEFQLYGFYPNPFNATTVASFELQVAGHVDLAVYDIQGKKVADLVDGWRGTGIHEVTFDGTGVASGIYFYRLKAGATSGSGTTPTTRVGKMVLLK